MKERKRISVSIKEEDESNWRVRSLQSLSNPLVILLHPRAGLYSLLREEIRQSWVGKSKWAEIGKTSILSYLFSSSTNHAME